MPDVILHAVLYLSHVELGFPSAACCCVLAEVE